MKYLKVWTDFEDIVSSLENDEIGRLFLDMLHYAKTGEEPADFPGNERFIWPVAKRDIDNAAEWNETCRANGSKGGRPRKNPASDESEKNPEKPNKTQQNPEEPTDNLKEKKRNEMKRNENNFFLSEEEAGGIQGDHDRLFDAAADAGFKSTNAERAGLLNLYAEYGLEKMLSGINECVTHSAPNLAYLAAVLKGSGKKKADAREIHGYDQRDYSGEQAKAIERMMAAEDW